jgi:hypothetical protein
MLTARFLVRENGERLAVVDTRKGEAFESVLHVLSPGARGSSRARP